MSDLKNAYIILSTQRSGSTLLCKDMTSTSIMGNPDEHALKYLSPNKAFSWAELYETCLDDSGNFGIKLMANYLDQALQLLNSELSFSKEASLESFIEYLQSSFDRVVVIYLTRDDYFEQALSRILAQKTNSWHDFGNGIQMNNGKTAAYKDVQTQRLSAIDELTIGDVNRHINGIIQENRMLAKLYKDLSDSLADKYQTNYNQVVYSSGTFLSAVSGRPVHVNRNMKKVSDEESVRIAKEKYFTQLNNTLTESFTDVLRDSALACEKEHIYYSQQLMAAAHIFRPGGPFIKKKHLEYSKAAKK